MLKIDWREQLVGPGRRRATTDREKLANGRKRKGRKNHSVNRERSHVERTKAAKAASLIRGKVQALRRFKEKVSAYWRGERDEHP